MCIGAWMMVLLEPTGEQREKRNRLTKCIRSQVEECERDRLNFLEENLRRRSVINQQQQKQPPECSRDVPWIYLPLVVHATHSVTIIIIIIVGRHNLPVAIRSGQESKTEMIVVGGLKLAKDRANENYSNVRN